MLGIIIGDIVGSTREGRKSHFGEDGLITHTEKNAILKAYTPPEPMLHEQLTFTDDTVLMLATDKALRAVEDERAAFAKHYTDFFDMHCESNTFYRGPGIGYGPKFMEWAMTRLGDEPNRGGYQSYGNGSAMRVGPIAYRFDNMTEMLNVARMSAICTHDHIKGIEGAQMVALAMWAARKGATPRDIKHLIEENSTYSLEFNEEQLIKHYVFNPTCQGSVPHAIWAALEGPDFPSVMKRCLRIGGDTDTIAAMAGGIAEILYGLPDSWALTGLRILQKDGPFLHEQYTLAVESCAAYPRYPNKSINRDITNDERTMRGFFATLRKYISPHRQ